MKKRLLRYLPKRLIDLARTVRHRFCLANELVHDYIRISQHTVILEEKSKVQLQASLAAAIHGVEKGLSLKSPRTWFGISRIEELESLLRLYAAKFGTDHYILRGVGTLESYLEFHRIRNLVNIDLEKKILALRKELLSQDDAPAPGPYGTLERSKQQIYTATQINWEAFLKTRHSVRQFSDMPVKKELLETAVSLAQMSPSVCNRQTSRVIAIRTNMDKVLNVQGGNTGFGEQASWVLAVLSETGLFFPGERNQCWIDGGMFAMTLVYSLHSLGLGTCCLEWLSLNKKDKELRKLVPVRKSECIIMLIAVGHLPEKFCVASSPRLPTSEVLRFLECGDAYE